MTSINFLKNTVPSKRFDVFLSYSSIDKPWVSRLKDALQTKGVKVWLDYDEICPGTLFVGALERGLEESKAVALVISPEAMISGWVNEEYSRALSLAQSKKQPLHLIPVLLREADLPGFLANRNWVDFRDEAMFDKSLEQLIWGITGKKPTISTPGALKKRALVDRRLVTEIVVLFRDLDKITNVDPRVPLLLQYSLGLFEHLLVENIYGSALEVVVHKQQEILGRAISFFERPKDMLRDDEDEYATVVEDAGDKWSEDLQFQLVVTDYEKLKGNNKGNTAAQITYLQQTLRLAGKLDAAIIPHPDRWPLYRLWFERCIWATGSEFPGGVSISLPEDLTEPSLQTPQTRQERLSQMALKIPKIYKYPLALVRYGPLPYPFPTGLLRHYDREDMARLQPFLYEFCVPAYNASHQEEDLHE